MDFMKRGELAKKCGINIEALRYYEKRKLINSPRRSTTGYRLYTEEDAAKIRFIKNAQKLGFTLKEIIGLLKLRVREKERCASVLMQTQMKLEEVEARINGLKSMRRILKQLIEKCENETATTDCPILATFESGGRV